jgi:DNA-directed RNA polymerase subunit E'/Rpb7
VSILDIGKGMVLSGSGQAEFVTRYRAIVFKPFKGEVVDGVVGNVNKVSGLDASLVNASLLRRNRWASLPTLDL